MLGHTGSALHRKKEAEAPAHDWDSEPSTTSPSYQNVPFKSKSASPGFRMAQKDGILARHFNTFSTLLLALLLIMTVTGFPASLFSKPFLCNNFPLLLKHDRDCMILRTSESGWDSLQTFGAGEIPEAKKAAPVQQKTGLSKDSIAARAKQLLEQAEARGQQVTELPRGVLKTNILREAVAKQLQPWLGETWRVYSRKDLEELHARFPLSVRVVVQGKDVQVTHHKEQEEKPEW